MNCTQCHFYPSGGGPRTAYGKIYGSHEHAPAITSNSDYYAGDFRAEAYSPTKKASQQTSGLVLMVAAASAIAPLYSNQDGSSLRAALTADFGSLSSGTREAVLLWKTPDSHGWLAPDYLSFGRFYVPFGLLSDEHRTYTKMQTLSSIRDYEMGAYASWGSASALHFDLALTNGFQSGGQPTSKDLTYAIIPNLRWNPPSLPFLLGTSLSYHRSLSSPSPYAWATYGGLSFHKLTQDFIQATWLAEVAVARHWNASSRNPRIGHFFQGTDESTAYLSSIAQSQSLGIYTELIYDLSKQFALNYKFDHLELDHRFPGDAYQRHGFGFRWFFQSNLHLIARYEIGHPKREAAQNKLSHAAQDLFCAMLRLWI